MGINSTGFEFELVLTAGCADTGGTVSPDARFWRPHARHARYAPPICPSRVRIASAHPTRHRGGRADLWKVVFCCVLTLGKIPTFCHWDDPDLPRADGPPSLGGASTAPRAPRAARFCYGGPSWHGKQTAEPRARRGLSFQTGRAGPPPPRRPSGRQPPTAAAISVELR